MADRNYFHVMPVVPPASTQTCSPCRWSIAPDELTRERLGPDHPDAGTYYCKGKEGAIRQGRAIAKRNEPSELIWHRHPKPGESGYPIAGRNTYPRKSDPKKSEG